MDELSQRLHQHAVSRFPNGVLVVFDGDLRYRLVGPEVLPFSRREAAEMTGKTIYELFPGETAAELEPELRATLDGEPRSFDVAFEGHIHHIETQPTEIDGEPYGVLVTQNVTDERYTTEQLRVLNRIVRHDIRNDVSIMLGWAELLDERFGDELDAEARQYLTRILDSGEHILELTTIVRDAVQMLVRGGEMPLEPTSLDSTLATEIALRREAFPDAEFRVEEACGRVDVMANELLSSVFRNLLNNAVQHNDSDVPVVEIRCDVGPDEVIVEIADNGPGIPDERKESLFGKPGAGMEHADHGIGLYLVAELVTQYGGRVWVEDGAEHSSAGSRTASDGTDPRGAVFCVRLRRST
jgi:signal transduction histidine kinase